jgi:hypothetical protein
VSSANRNGLVVGATLTPATGTAEREAALTLVDRLGSKRRISDFLEDRGTAADLNRSYKALTMVGNDGRGIA